MTAPSRIVSRPEPSKPMPDKAASSRIADLERRIVQEPSAKLFLELAREHHTAGQLEMALEACGRGLRKYPKYVSLRVLEGRVLFELGRIEDARDVMESVVTLAPDNLVARRFVAEICFSEGDFHGALDRFRAVLAFNPADAAVQDRVAEIERQIASEAAGAPQEPELMEGLPVPEAVAAGLLAPAEQEPIRAPSAPDEATEYLVLEDAEDAEEAEEAVEPLSSVAAAAAAPVEPAGVPEDVPCGLDRGVLATPTLAEIFVQQGLTESARDVYRQILKGDPGHLEARTRLAELEGKVAAPADPEAERRRRKVMVLTAWLDAIHESRHA